jgi:hypothetical protein
MTAHSRALRFWLDSWSGIGRVAVGMARLLTPRTAESQRAHHLRSVDAVRHRRVAGWVQLHAAVGVIAVYVRGSLGGSGWHSRGDGLLRVRLDKSEEEHPA